MDENPLNPDQEESNSEWLQKMIPGVDPDKPVNVLVRWNHEEDSCELCVHDPNYEADLREWSRWANNKDLFLREGDTDEEGRQWIEFHGPGARDLFEAVATQASELPSSEDYETNRATLGGAIAGAGLGKPVNKDAIQGARPEKAMPEWEGTPSFRQVWESTDWMHMQYRRPRIVSSMDVVGADARVAMGNAHPIVIPPQQVAALPTLSFSEAIEYIAKAHLPFQTTFIDATDSPNARDLMLLKTGGGDVGFVGGLVADLEKDGMRGVVPCGAVVYPTDNGEANVVDDAEYVPGQPALLSDPSGHGLPSHAPIATFLIAEALRDQSPGIVFRTHEYGGVEPLDRLRSCRPHDEGLEVVSASGEVIEPGVSNVSIVPAVADLFSFQKYTPEVAYERIEGWIKMAAYQVRTLASVMMFLDSHNVEIVEQAVSRPVRRQAKRKGIPISKTVYIRHRHSKNGQHDWDPNAERTVGTDHQYEVIGHTRHFTKGSHVWCKACKGAKEIEGPLLPDGNHEMKTCEKCNGSGLDPENVTPCARRDEKTGLLTCPDGCRKEWVPTFVKGNPDAPLVLKTRKQT
jgi:hypothetical protein